MTERASDLLSGLAERLSADSRDSGQVVAESVRSLEPWQQYYALAREASRRYAEKGIPLESVMEGLAVFRRSVLARVTEEMSGNEYADEVLLLAQSRLGDVVEQ